MYQTTVEEAWGLVHSMASQCLSKDGFGTMSPAAYDTAWVAMTERVDQDGKCQSLFPEAYEYLKSTQAEDGTWAAETSEADGIINTLAGLLALKRREKKQTLGSDSKDRCQRAEAALHRMLSGWDLEATDRVGLEILVPNLLRLLEAEGVRFDFPARKQLMALNSAKLARLGPVLTSPVQTTLVHTLEAFVGTLDFDKVKHHKMPNGSMLASPSSTAAYLMNATVWDFEAEAYLRMVFDQQASIGHKGGFPSAFPSTLFEVSWVIDTLLEAGYEKEDFLRADLRKLEVVLENNLKAQKGIIGFAPSSLPDADDTAKTISALRLMGWEHSVDPMLKAFEADKSFITYRGERNASSSANCNILSCLLRTPSPAKYTKAIVKCASFLCETWMSNNGPDKWHTSVHYPMMLIAQAFVQFLKVWGRKALDMELVPRKLCQDIPRTLLDILARTMRLQQADGSWESKREVTAYSVLTLAPLLALPWVDFLKPEGIACMYRGKAYLEERRQKWREGEVLWIEKTAYSSDNLSQAYCLAASKIVVPMSSISQSVADLFPAQLNQKIAKMSGFFSHVLPFNQAPIWKLQLSLLQSAQYAGALKKARYDIFPLMVKASDEKYQEYIPFTWIGCRDFLSTAITAESLWEMMLVSMFNFQIDAYMETDVWDQYKHRLPELKAFIRELCAGTSQKRKRSEEQGKDADSIPKKRASRNGAVNGSLNSYSNDDTGGHVNKTTNGAPRDSSNGNLDAAGDEKVPEDDAAQACSKVEEFPDKTSNGTTDGTSKNGTSYGKVEGESQEDTTKTNGSNVPAAPAKIASTNGTNGTQSTNGVIVPNGHSADPSKEREQCLQEAAVRRLQTKSDVKIVLTRFVHFALHHPMVVKSPPALRSWLAQEMQTFLLAHITHMEDCAEMPHSAKTANGMVIWQKPRTTFFNWVRTTSADHTSCPYSFVFFLCLIGEGKKDIIRNVQQRYALEDACRHLATMCRQYNDFGSVLRDQEEKNLNSVNFPEFHAWSLDDEVVSTKVSSEMRKGDLLAVADYERRCLARVIEELRETLDPKAMEKLDLFVQVTDLYGQIYVARDIGIRRVEQGQAA